MEYITCSANNIPTSGGTVSIPYHTTASYIILSSISAPIYTSYAFLMFKFTQLLGTLHPSLHLITGI